ncbi:hypothetical protein JRO89_XS15G0183600 [Xanthoceras sorbifolium]|uniref:Disease resistance RPP13-like protein 1 n=1 Tax=Xanthoceras sorbifolium TaxID=99658 RepID=A0ABQ8H2U6_9ROSI|nr:hypothetical protein JRO89_XS15G0183600 [Xanthoceras sorbifolium]
MAELFLSAVLPVLFEKLTSPQLLKFATQEGVSSKLKKWEKTLKMIEALLIDAEEKQLKNGAVKSWLDELQDLAYDAEDILDEYATEALSRKLKIEEHQASTSRARKLIPACCFGCTPSALWSDFNMRSKIDDVTNRLDVLCRQRTELGLVQIAGERSNSSWQRRPPTTSLQTELAVYGRDQDKAKILEMVLRDDEPAGGTNFGVISIVAMGGVGKTTLAREVYNDKTVKDFNPKAWVCISDDFDVTRISMAILESITGCASELKTLEAVQNQLKEKLAGRKFLLVLDDVWSEDYSKWEILRSPLIVGAHGSRIIVTTRHERVALTMGRSSKCHRLKLLSDSDCWSLFKKHAFDNEVMGAQPSELIRQKVIEKCKGLALVAKTLGGLLRAEKREKWLDILNSKLWELQDESEIPTALQISYYHLPSHLKRCFAYCAILPKDYEFEERELVCLWMAEGLIQQSSDNEQLEDLGGEYFCDLLSRSMFQISSSNTSKFAMHDLLNDLAQMVSRKLSFRLDDESVSNNRSKVYTRYASYICHQYNDKRKFKVLADATHLRTHLSMPPINEWHGAAFVSHSVISDLFLRFKKLRVLSLKNLYIIELPDSMGGLRLLRYLNLSNTKIRSLPESTNSMCNLQTLLLRNCRKFLKWPYSMGNLINLRHLDMSGASLVTEMPGGISKWDCLRTLSNFIVGKDSKSTLKDLKYLKFLCGELHISRLENVIGFDDTVEFILSDKKDLKVLLLEWGSSLDESRDENADIKVLDMLQPHQNLEMLTIKCYGGTQFSSWFGGSSLSKSKLTILELVDCMKCTSLPSLGLLSSLKSLTIEGMKAIKSIGFEFYGDGWSKPFPALETLRFENLEEWECWDPVKENESFSQLQELSIVNCPKLSERLPNNLSTLKKLVVRGCKQLVVSLSNIPRLCELEIDECKKIVCNGPTGSNSLESMALSNILYFGDWSRQEFKKLQSVKIQGCKELIELWQDEIFLEKSSQGLHSLVSLKKLTFENCNTLTTLLEGVKKKNAHVEELRITNCDSLNFIFRGQLPPSLKKLCISDCEKLQCLLDDNEETSTSLSSTIVNFSKNVNTSTYHLEDLDISGCSSLTCLPSIDQLSATLTSLSISDCSKLTTLSLTDHLPVALKHLTIEDFSGSGALLPKGQLLPESLETLSVHRCQKLKWIVDKFHNNNALQNISIVGCDNLESLPEGLYTLSGLRHINLAYCKELVCFPKGGFPSCNFKVHIQNCDKLEALPSRVHTLSSLTIMNCPNISLSEEGTISKELISFPEGGCPTSNFGVYIQRCHKLEALPIRVHTLSSLAIMDCPNMSLSEEGLPTNLARLSIEGLKQYKPLMRWGLHNLTSLTYLSISGEPDGESLQEEDMRITLPRTLTQLRIEKLRKLKYLSFKDFEDLPSLESLSINNCLELTSLPSLPSSLLQLHILYCPLLREACKRDKGKEWPKIADIPCVNIDGKFIYDPVEASEN